MEDEKKGGLCGAKCAGADMCCTGKSAGAGGKEGETSGIKQRVLLFEAAPGNAVAASGRLWK